MLNLKGGSWKLFICQQKMYMRKILALAESHVKRRTYPNRLKGRHDE